MRLIFTTAIAVALLSLTALPPTANAASMKDCAANWKTMSAGDKGKTNYKDYSAKCLKGDAAPAAGPSHADMMKPEVKHDAMAKPEAKHDAMAPMAMKASGPMPNGATAQCKDGSFYTSKTHSGACSHHGGVTKWL